jgi:chaperone modulatory protein CbpM
MNTPQIIIGVLIEETSSMPFEEVCNRYNIPKELLIDMIEHGLFSNPAHDIEHTQLNPKDLRRIESAFRLHRDLEINLPGVAVALELLEELEYLRTELDILRKQV